MNLMEKYPILQHMGKEEQMFRGSCLMGFSLDHKNLKIGAHDVESSFTMSLACRASAGGCEPKKWG
jgi:hypothetical protein